MLTTIANLIQQFSQAATAIRHRIHQHPELKYDEHHTAQLVADTLTSYGYEPTMGIGKTGVVAVLDSGKPGKTVALRADMDALPIHETTGLPYASQIAGVMHACGHDGHTATLLLAAGVLMQCREQFTGKIKFIFQPAEEGGLGAEAMIQDGVLESPHVDAIFGYHNSPGLPLGKVGMKSGSIFSSATWFQIDIEGLGGSSTHPNKTINPLLIGSHIIQNLQTIVASMISPQETCSISVTQFQAGKTNNVIPATAMLAGSFRVFSTEFETLMKQKIHDIAKAATTIYGGNTTITFPMSMPPTINDEKMTALVHATARELYDDSQILLLEKPYMASEDFSCYLQRIPGCYFVVGNNSGTRNLIHHSDFRFHDEIMPIAATMLVCTALNYLK